MQDQTVSTKSQHRKFKGDNLHSAGMATKHHNHPLNWVISITQIINKAPEQKGSNEAKIHSKAAITQTETEARKGRTRTMQQGLYQHWYRLASQQAKGTIAPINRQRNSSIESPPGKTTTRQGHHICHKPDTITIEQ